MTDENRAAAPPNAGRQWAFSLAGLCLAIIAYGIFFATNSSNNVLRLLLINGPLALVLWFVFQLVVGRRHPSRNAGITYLLILCSLLISDLTGHYLQKRQSDKNLASLRAALYGAAPGANSNLHSGDDCATLNEARVPRDDMGIMTQFMSGFYCRVRGLNDQYARELGESGLAHILDAEQISRDRALENSPAILEKAALAVSVYSANLTDLLRAERARLQASRLTADSKTEALRSFDMNIERGRQQLESQMQREREILEEYSAAIAILRSEKGAWAVSQGRLMFTRESSRQAFQTHISAIERISSEEQSAQKQATDRALSTVESLSK